MAANGTTPTAEANPSVSKRAFAADVAEEIESLTGRIAAAETSLGTKAPLNNAELTGNPTAPTQSDSNNSTRISTTAFVHSHKALLQAAIDLKAPLASPALTGDPTAPTQTAGNNSTRLATTAYADAADALLKAAIDFEEARATNIASASTTNIAGATGKFVQVSGTATINALGVATPGATRVVRFLGAGTITHNGTTLLLPGGANITRAANDTGIFISISGGEDAWICAVYQRANGKPVVNPAIADLGIDVATVEEALAGTANTAADLMTPLTTKAVVSARVGPFEAAIDPDYRDDGSNGNIVVVDPDGNIVWSDIDSGGGGGGGGSSEPVGPIFGDWYLRQTRHAIASIQAGVVKQLPILVVGDSWSDNERYWLQALTLQLQAEFGDAGAGYTGFAWGEDDTPLKAHKNARDDVVLTISADDWTPTWRGYATPDGGKVRSSTPGAPVTIAYPAGNGTAILYFLGTEDGEARYRWDSGSWTTLDLTGDGTLDLVTLTGMPTGATTLRIEVVDGTVDLTGVFAKGSGSGVRVDKIARSGANLGQYLEEDETEWVSGITPMAPKLIISMFGTNDQASIAPSEFGSRTASMTDRLRVVDPLADVLIMMPPENALGRSTSMFDFADYARAVAVDKKCAFLDLQGYFGDTVSQYNWASSRKWLGADGAHPSATGEVGFGDGGKVISGVLRRLLTTR